MKRLEWLLRECNIQCPFFRFQHRGDWTSTGPLNLQPFCVSAESWITRDEFKQNFPTWCLLQDVEEKP